jgi:hypothetical protein
MIKVVICEMERVYDSSLFSWIREQYCRRKSDGAEFWFRVSIRTHDVDLLFSSSACPKRGGRRKPQVNQREQRIVDLWTSMGVAAGSDIDLLLRFLHRVNEMLG